MPVPGLLVPSELTRLYDLNAVFPKLPDTQNPSYPSMSVASFHFLFIIIVTSIAQVPIASSIPPIRTRQENR